MEQRRITDHLDSRDRLIRLEEKITHVEKLVQDQKHGATSSINELRKTLEKFMDGQQQAQSIASDRVISLEKRVDKIYTIGAIAVFVIQPIIAIMSKTILAHFGM